MTNEQTRALLRASATLTDLVHMLPHALRIEPDDPEVQKLVKAAMDLDEATAPLASMTTGAFLEGGSRQAEVERLRKQVQRWREGYGHCNVVIRRLEHERNEARAKASTPNTIGDRAVTWSRREFGEQTLERDVLQLSEETGEVARAVGKASEGIRAHDRGNLGDELADVIIAATKAARRQGIDLDAVVARRLQRMEGLRFNTSATPRSSAATLPTQQ